MEPHYSVLKNETIDFLNIKEDGVYVDATVGYAGHSKKILEKCKKGFLFAFDQDEKAVEYSNNALASVSDNFRIFKENFVSMKKVLNDANIFSVDGIIFDLGFSSPQIDDASRGFSFMVDARLDMRMNSDNELSAYEVVNNYSKEELTNIFFEYGEEKMSSVIASKIVEVRKTSKIETTLQLVDVIKNATGAKYFFNNHPERQIFQAIRIEVNHELDVLKKVLPDAIDLLKSGGRLCVITFHSLEDKIVKRIFKEYSEVDPIVKGLPVIPKEYEPKIKIINKKAIAASDNELNENSRSRSAHLRVIERI